MVYYIQNVFNKKNTIRKEGIKMAALHLTEANFEQEVLNADIPVLVDFGLLGAVLAKCYHL